LRRSVITVLGLRETHLQADVLVIAVTLRAQVAADARTNDGPKCLVALDRYDDTNPRKIGLRPERV